MYGSIFPGYFLSEVMHHERGRNTLELREGRAKCFRNISPLEKLSGGGKLFPGNTLTGEGFKEANKGVTSYFICNVLKDTDLCVVFVDKLQQNLSHSWLIFCFETASTVMGFWSIGGVETVALLPLTRTNTWISALKRRKKNQHPTELSGFGPINSG